MCVWRITDYETRQRPLVRLIKLFLGSLAALAVLAVLLVTALLFLDLGMFRGQIEARGTEAFDRRLTIAGPMRLKPSFQPLLVVEDVRIGNPEWASRPDFAHIQRLEIRVALWPPVPRAAGCMRSSGACQNQLSIIRYLGAGTGWAV